MAHWNTPVPWVTQNIQPIMQADNVEHFPSRSHLIFWVPVRFQVSGIATVKLLLQKTSMWSHSLAKFSGRRSLMLKIGWNHLHICGFPHSYNRIRFGNSMWPDSKRKEAAQPFVSSHVTDLFRFHMSSKEIKPHNSVYHKQMFWVAFISNKSSERENSTGLLRLFSWISSACHWSTVSNIR